MNNCLGNEFTLVLLNIQSVRNKIDELFLFLESIDFPNIVILVEHWLRPEESLYVPDYILVSKFSRNIHAHGGTLIMIRKDFLQNCMFSNSEKFNYILEEKIFEFSILHCSEHDLFIIAVYRAPSADVSVFLEKLEQLLSEISVGASIVLAGDLNIDFSNRSNSTAQALNNLISSFNLSMHVSGPTRLSPHSSSTIDYLCTTFDNGDVRCDIVNAALSDHEAVVACVPLLQSISKDKIRRGRLYSKRNYDRFTANFEQTEWEKVLCTDDLLHGFHTALVNAFNSAFPLVVIKNKMRKPWITPGLRVSAKNMKSLHLIRKFNSDNVAFMEYFNSYRKIYRKIIKTAKRNYYHLRILNSKNRSRESWKIINKLRGGSGIEPVSSSSLDAGAGQINDYYCNIAHNLSTKIVNPGDPKKYLSHVSVPDTFFLSPTSAIEISEVLGEMRNKNSFGWDGVPLRVLLAMPQRAVGALADAINSSFSKGAFPACLKEALIVPLHKGGDCNIPSNFRPISLLPTLAKVVEKLVGRRMVDFLNKHDLLSAQQFGFRASRSTNDAIFNLLERLYLELNSGEHAAAVFCDLTKAFDCVDHGILLSKLDIYGFRGVAWDWFQSYLSGRVQGVTFKGQCSEGVGISVGIPQGSVLGPLLFLIYVNDLPRLTVAGRFTIFADDTTILWHNKDVGRLRADVQADLSRVKGWCDANKLSFNIAKTKILSFRCNIENVNIENEIISATDKNSFLGLIIDSSLRFEDHIGNICSKISSGCYALRVIASSLGLSVARTSYFSLVEAHLRYGICFWACCSRVHFSSVFVLQKRAIRYISGAGLRESCRPLFPRLGILTLCALFILETAIMIFKKHRLEAMPVSRHGTRRAFVLPLPAPKSELIKSAIVYNGKKIYNHLPLNLRELNCERVFRRKTRALLIKKAYYTLEEFYNDRLE